MRHIQFKAKSEHCVYVGWIAYNEEIPGITSQGETIEKTGEILTSDIQLIFRED
jgi:hypothetical protein